MFHVHFFNRASVYDFDEPPKSVLELGCGSGIWVVDAAKRWKVGFSIHLIRILIEPVLENHLRRV